MNMFITTFMMPFEKGFKLGLHLVINLGERALPIMCKLIMH
jgi:hypothetical protein